MDQEERIELLEEVAKLAHYMHEYQANSDDWHKMGDLLRKLGFKLDVDS